MSDAFLPSDYSVKSGNSGYMKFEKGENRFRILERPVLGYELWIDKKPHRFHLDQPIPQEIADKAASQAEEGRAFVKEFWAMPVWDYKTEKVKILEITQKRVLKAIETLARNAKWGSPLGYDIVVTRSGEKQETEYVTQPEPKEELDAGIAQMFKDMEINTEALFTGDNPFGPKQDEIDEEEVDKAMAKEKEKEADIPF